MNTTRTTPPPSTPNRSLTAHELALEAAGTAVALALKLPAPLRTLADQLIRSASSVPANLAEGAGRAGRDRLHHWRIAYASALEADSHLRLLLRAGAVDGAKAAQALELFDRVRALTWRLIHPRR
ncbi:MAG: four helix bundle protein [Acidobacteriota bacterium]|jgi:four helix bundle protein